MIRTRPIFTGQVRNHDADPGCIPLRQGRRRGLPAGAHARRAGGRPLLDAAVPAVRGPVHPDLLRPSLQWTLGGCARLVHDLGEPDGGRRRAAPEAGFRQVGRARPFVRRPGGPRVRAALSRQPVAPRAARHGRRQSLGAGECPRGPRQARLRPADGKAGPALLQRADRAERDGPGPDAVWQRVLPPPQHLAAGTRDDPGRVAREDPARGAHLRGPPAAQGLDGHGSARRDHGADAGDGRTGSLPR
jgi:hypothetical protein